MKRHSLLWTTPMNSNQATAGTSRRPQVFAFGLDAANHDLLLEWQKQGLLPNLSAFAQRSARWIVTHAKQYSNEHCWIPMLTGMKQDKWDHWLAQWNPATYGFSEASLYNWDTASIFYALGDSRKVAAFDLSGPLSPE